MATISLPSTLSTSGVNFEPGANLGPLTTTFTPPSSCSMFFNANLGSTCYTDSSDSTWVADDPNCWPSATVIVPTGNPLSGFGFYSPGLQCPSGHTTACYGGAAAAPTATSRFAWDATSFAFNFPPAFNVDESIAGCCPTAYICTTSSNVQTCMSHGGTTASLGECVGTFFEVTTTSFSEGDVYAPLFQLNWQASDTSTTTLASSSSPPDPSTQSSSDQSSRNIGVGVIAGLVGLAVVVGTVWFVLRWRRIKPRPANGYTPAQASAPENGWYKPQLSGNGYHTELPGAREPAEMEGSGDIVYDMPVPGRDVPDRSR